MNYIKHLTGFFDKVSPDFDLNPTHISLYMAIFQLWNKNSFKNSIPISRDELMRISKIGSFATYHKCIKELDERYYVKYMPSFNQYKGSTLEVVSLESYKSHPEKMGTRRKARSSFKPLTEQDTEQLLNNSCTSAELLPYINYLNPLNLENGTASKNEDEAAFILLENGVEAPKKLGEKRGVGGSGVIPPDLEAVLPYFAAQGFPDVEAQKFYYHFQSNGWLVGGKSKMKDWRAAARNWMLNASLYQTKNYSPKANHLHTPNSKNYDEPL
jgi:hypothetical protein